MYNLTNVSYKYPDSDALALSGINLEFREGEFVILCGRNGGGKTTLLKALLGIIPEFSGGRISGNISLDKKDLRKMRVVELAGTIGILLQDPHSQVTNLTCFEEVAFGLENMCLQPKVISELAEKSLRDVRMAGLENQMTYQLSGGQLQRLSLASLFAMYPSVLLMDEPLANLDPQGSLMVVETLRQLKAKLTIVSSHLIEPFIELATRIIVLDEGRIVLDFPINQLDSYKDDLTKHAVYIPDHGNGKGPINRGTSETLIKMDRVNYVYPGGYRALNNVSCVISRGEQALVVGSNGSGKTTFAKILVGLKKPSSGMVESKARKPWYVHQSPTVSFLKSTVMEEVLYGHHSTPDEARRLIEYFGLAKYANQSPFTISGGQQRLVALAAAFGAHPDLLVLDEPTAGLDAEYAQKMLEITRSFPETVVHVTHDPRIMTLHPSQILNIESGKLSEVQHVTGI